MEHCVVVAMAGLLATSPCLAGDDCGAAAAPCAVASGAYFAAAPPWRAGDPARPVVVFLHGAGGSGEAALADRDLVKPIVARGYVLLAPTGLPRDGRAGRYWSLGDRAPSRDDDRFLKEVLEDAVPRFHLDPSRVFATGFSMGAGALWRMACHDPTAFAAFGPVAGGFWHGSPTSCAGPVKMLLTHGWRDDAVPIEGWADGQAVQGNVLDGVQVWRRVDGCPDPHAASYATVGRFWQRGWAGCAPGAALTFVLHPGGHEVPPGWADMALDWFETVVPAADRPGPVDAARAGGAG